MYCRNCGQEIDDKADFCVHCGVRVNKESSPIKEHNLMALIGFVAAFFFPIAGLICSILAYKGSSEYRNGYKNFAIAGIAISSGALIFIVVLVVLFFTGILLSPHFMV